MGLCFAVTRRLPSQISACGSLWASSLPMRTALICAPEWNSMSWVWSLLLVFVDTLLLRWVPSLPFSVLLFVFEWRTLRWFVSQKIGNISFASVVQKNDKYSFLVGGCALFLSFSCYYNCCEYKLLLFCCSNRYILIILRRVQARLTFVLEFDCLTQSIIWYFFHGGTFYCFLPYFIKTNSDKHQIKSLAILFSPIIHEKYELWFLSIL